MSLICHKETNVTFKAVRVSATRAQERPAVGVGVFPLMSSLPPPPSSSLSVCYTFKICLFLVCDDESALQNKSDHSSFQNKEEEKSSQKQTELIEASSVSR